MDALDNTGDMEHEKQCRDLLKRLMDNELFVAVAICGVKQDGSVGTTYYHRGANIFTMLGGVDFLKQRIHNEQVESTTHDLDGDAD